MSKDNNCCTPSRNTPASSSREIHERNRKNKNTTSAQSDNMIKIAGGTFMMGTDSKEGFEDDGEGPVREVKVDPFYIDSTTVTNAQFKTFIKDSGYRTEAEAFGWSFVFKDFIPDSLSKNKLPTPQQARWWKGVEGADWEHPEGPETNIKQRMDHPVVHVSWNDARAYCQWAYKRLPTEAEWEYAARGGLQQKKYPWGDELTPSGNHRCNIWQGGFPDKNTEEDGYAGTAPADSYPPNGYGLYNVAGNVWEWCHDWFSPSYPLLSINDNPQGPGKGSSKVIRGGSYLCHRSYCNRYRVAARTSNTPESSTGNMGFRCVKNA